MNYDVVFSLVHTLAHAMFDGRSGCRVEMVLVQVAALTQAVSHL